MDRSDYQAAYRERNKEKLKQQRKDWTINNPRKYRGKWNKFFRDSGFGECCVCGYSKCMASLEFHHVNPTDKEFSIGNVTRKPFIPENIQSVLTELEKCVVLCANCHREFHFMDLERGEDG